MSTVRRVATFSLPVSFIISAVIFLYRGFSWILNLPYPGYLDKIGVVSVFVLLASVLLLLPCVSYVGEYDI